MTLICALSPAQTAQVQAPSTDQPPDSQSAVPGMCAPWDFYPHNSHILPVVSHLHLWALGEPQWGVLRPESIQGTKEVKFSVAKQVSATGEAD